MEPIKFTTVVEYGEIQHIYAVLAWRRWAWAWIRNLFLGRERPPRRFLIGVVYPEMTITTVD